MKKLILIFSIITFISCNSDDDAGDVITNKFEQITAILPQGSWEVSKLIDGSDDHTVDFESFIFTFYEDGTVVGETDLFTDHGNWMYRSTSKNGEQLLLAFNDVTPFNLITEDWTIVSISNSRVELSLNGEIDGVTNFLVFTKL